MILRWLPWKFFLKRAAGRYGVIDPISFMARLRRFSQPSEVQEPIELLRAGIAFHARGLINTKVIQYNLDWNWPYWVKEQFDPNGDSFIPRSFSFSHVNLTHRNWTAVGHPEHPVYPIVDPRGLITPLFDGWSVDFWMISENGEKLFPSELKTVEQRLDIGKELRVSTRSKKDSMELSTNIWVASENGRPVLHLSAKGFSTDNSQVVMALRPFNPEGVQFIEKIEYDKKTSSLRVNSETDLNMMLQPNKVLFSDYYEGDVVNRLNEPAGPAKIACDMGMATAAAVFKIPANQSKTIETVIPLEPELNRENIKITETSKDWKTLLSDGAKLDIPDAQLQFLYDAAVRSLLLLSADDAVPGPYTYRRFWFRDACLMMYPILCLGFEDRVYRLLTSFPQRQKLSGYFQSQEGEWDSNGQVLWIIGRFQQLTGAPLDKDLIEAAYKGAEWIRKKRIGNAPGSLHQGLFPAGFSAEHLGPNDYYYWDDFWGLTGLKAAADIAKETGNLIRREEFEKEAADFERCIFDSISKIPQHKSSGGIPASCYRRMDAGAIGSLVADYPLRITPPGNDRIMQTVEYLMNRCFVSGAFFQDMIHSGINAYLTLAIAQTLLRNGDPRYRDLIRNVATLASPTGQWPEAIHPRTRGGCMGDGQHGWAAAEWVMMIRNLFVREETGGVIIGSGVFPEWLQNQRPISFGPTLTSFGRFHVSIVKDDNVLNVDISTDIRSAPEYVRVAIPGYRPQTIDDLNRTYIIEEE